MFVLNAHSTTTSNRPMTSREKLTVILNNQQHCIRTNNQRRARYWERRANHWTDRYVRRLLALYRKAHP